MTADTLQATSEPGTVSPPGRIDRDAARTAVEAFLDAMGVDRNAPGLERTSERVVEMMAELLTPPSFDVTTFPNDAGYDEMVLVSDIAFTSLCEHHLLPFRGVAHVAYVPGSRIVGLSKMARLVEATARRPQVQERMTSEIADWLHENLRPRGVGVVLEAEHLCMAIRGVRSPKARTITSALLGRLRDDPATRQEFLSLAHATTRR